VSHVEQELPTLPGHLISPQVLSVVRVGQSFVFCVIFCRSLFVLFRLAILLSILRFTASDYPSGIFKTFLYSETWNKGSGYLLFVFLENLWILPRMNKEKSQREDEHVWHPYECRISVEKHFFYFNSLNQTIVVANYNWGFVSNTCWINISKRFAGGSLYTSTSSSLIEGVKLTGNNQFIDTFLPFVLILYIK
jgi:hypothetical protein